MTNQTKPKERFVLVRDLSLAEWVPVVFWGCLFGFAFPATLAANQTTNNQDVLVKDADAEPLEIKSRGIITEVTLYPKQARVVREITVPKSDELQHIRVIGLPEELLGDSAFTESDNEIMVQSMKIVGGENALSKDPLRIEKLKQLEDEKTDLERKKRIAENDLAILEQNLETVEKMVDFSANKSKQALDQATLNVESLTQLADFAIERRRTLAKEYFETESTIDSISTLLEDNAKQRNQMTDFESQVTLDAMMTIQANQGGVVRLVYEVANVSWTPKYKIFATRQGDRHRFQIQLDAEVFQLSGEPWENAKLTIATSLPDAQAGRPLLAPLRVRAISKDEEENELAEFERHTRFTADRGWMNQELLQKNFQLNSTASRRQVGELTSAIEVQRMIADDASNLVSDESYKLDQAVTVANRSQLQTVKIMSQTLDGKLNRIVTPLLSSFAYREAKLINESAFNLIPGNAMVYLDGKYVGQTLIPPTTAGQRMTIGLGTDRKIRTRREIVSREEAIQGGNRKTSLICRLVISNYHETPVDIRLLDRIPVAANDGSVTIALDTRSEAALSKDKLYQKVQQPAGVLRWDLTMPAKSFGSEAYDHEYEYSIEMDRQQTIVSKQQQLRRDLQFEKSNSGMGGMGGGGMGGSF